MSSINNKSPLGRSLTILALIISGETIFLLPFVTARIFRPTLLEAFQLTNLELGIAFSVYGVVAMVSYFLGGPLADRFSAKKMMSFALLATGISGILFGYMPSFSTLTILYGFWGMTTILLFWAALIKATREWGGKQSQGLAYGLLDSGRGLFAAVIASLSVWVFAGLLPEDASTATFEEKKAALSFIIFLFSGFVVFIAILVWIVIPDSEHLTKPKSNVIIDTKGMATVIKDSSIWLHSFIILCAYVGYKSTDDFSLFASDGYGYDDVVSARVGTVSYWVRPIIAISAGIWADRISSSSVIILGFIVMLCGSLVIALGWIPPGIYIWLLLVVAVSSVGIYSLRAVYFALFHEANIPIVYTGSAIGLVSVIGFSPDIFMGPLMGVLIDNNPGILGHQYVFGVVAGFSIIGLCCTYIFRNIIKNKKAVSI